MHKFYKYFIGSKAEKLGLLSMAKFKLLVQYNVLSFIVCFFIGFPVGLINKNISLQVFMLALALIYLVLILITKYSNNNKLIFYIWLVSVSFSFSILFFLAKDSSVLMVGWVFVLILVVNFFFRGVATFIITVYFLILMYIKIKYQAEVEVLPVDLRVFQIKEYDIPFHLMLSGVTFALLMNNITSIKFNMIKRIENNVEEKEVLLKEIHHRVKNNLQVVIGLLGLQENQAEDKKLIEALQTSRNRVLSMAMVHEMLYSTDDIQTIQVKNYLESLIRNLISSYQMADRVNLTIKSNEINLSMDNAVPLGLLINEIVTNSLKYAFKDGRKGCIDIEFTFCEKGYCLIISDDGVGIKNAIPRNNSLGKSLISRLSTQLRGKISQESSDKGVRYELTFKGVDDSD